MMTPSQYFPKLTTSPTIPSYLPFCHHTRFLPLPLPSQHFASTFVSTKSRSHKIPNLVSGFREKPRLSPSAGCFASSSSMENPTQSSETKTFSVLFVCLGNICRSPAAEGVFRDIVKKRGLDSKFNIDSAGTIDYHECFLLREIIFGLCKVIFECKVLVRIATSNRHRNFTHNLTITHEYEHDLSKERTTQRFMSSGSRYEIIPYFSAW
ncbi:hypothetical protein EUTSA_v10003008mg [Eutrema salsugineum]|uniref:Phosphotyrosine protein phosphatase I domain-containing protein n=1 Tax=Eutrema salsugineum TaxID=72664 RepID=V4L1P7_EUTSA|nr:hypothetical protein EUTSA_v10003008mg [Eutrema salsugineum]